MIEGIINYLFMIKVVTIYRIVKSKGTLKVGWS